MKPSTKHKRLELLALIAGSIQPLFTIPQIVTVYANQSAQDVSLLTWAGYTVLGTILLLYGIAFKLRPIIVGQSIWVVLQTLMVVGVLLYR